MEMSLTKRAAHCLDFTATNYPKQYIPWNWVYQAIQGFARTPRHDSEAVINLRMRGSAIRQACISLYKRTTDTHPGLGVRALVDDEDVVRYAMVKSTKRFISAKNALVQTASLVDVKKLPNTPEFQEFKNWHTKGILPILREVGSAAFDKRLSAPDVKALGKGKGKKK